MRVAKVFEVVQAAWDRSSRAGRRMIRSSAMRSTDVGFCLRCKIVLNLVRGQSVQIGDL